ncbi:uncharacterized protein PG998_011684 [Apiospora kogelbergensis]|uniref:uncharacterized protein n=1 Tax=Apiospora kogelbergensis TaxID=1337665 RepID=UPI00312FD956
MVSDRPGAARGKVARADPVPFSCTFFGETLSPSARSGQAPQVVGNAFACLAPSDGAIEQMMEKSTYGQENIWDLKSTSISPLFTVHSSNFPSPPPTGTEQTTVQRSSSGGPEHLVVFPDSPNVLERRVAIRPRHSPNFVRLHNEGYVSWAGPVFEKHVDADISKRPFKGSVMVVNEGSWEALMERLKSDPYIQEKIWDLGKTSFIPFRTIMRQLN